MQIRGGVLLCVDGDFMGIEVASAEVSGSAECSIVVPVALPLGCCGVVDGGGGCAASCRRLTVLVVVTAA